METFNEIPEGLYIDDMEIIECKLNLLQGNKTFYRDYLITNKSLTELFAFFKVHVRNLTNCLRYTYCDADYDLRTGNGSRAIH